MDEKLDRKRSEEENLISNEYTSETSLNFQLLKTFQAQKRLEKNIDFLKSYKNQLKQLNLMVSNDDVHLKFLESFQGELEKELRLILESDNIDLNVISNSATNFEKRRLILTINKSDLEKSNQKPCQKMNEKIFELENKIKFIDTINQKIKHLIVADSENLINLIDHDCNIIYSK